MYGNTISILTKRQEQQHSKGQNRFFSAKEVPFRVRLKTDTFEYASDAGKILLLEYVFCLT